MSTHNDRTLDDDLKIFKTVKLGNKSSPLHDLIQQLVEHIAPVSKKQYVCPSVLFSTPLMPLDSLFWIKATERHVLLGTLLYAPGMFQFSPFPLHALLY